ncbi:MAG: ABC transporter substrate-binding protein [bacterium]
MKYCSSAVPNNGTLVAVPRIQIQKRRKVKMKRLNLFATLFLVLVLLIAGCMPIPTTAPVAESPVKKLVPFGVQQSWKNDAQSAPLHVAIEAGYYAEEGLDVHLVEGGPGIDGVLNTLAGRENIYIGFEAGESNLIPKRSEAGMPLVIIGALMQQKPEAYITLAENVPENAELTPALMKGQKIGVGGAENFKLEAMLSSAGLTLEDVELIRIDVSSAQALTMGLVDWANGWVINQTYDIEQAGFEWKALLLADWGNPMHGNLMYTTQERIEKEPELLAAFVRATLRGVQKCIDDPDYAIAATLKHGGGYDTPEKARYVIEGMNVLSVSADTEEHGFGWVNKDRVLGVAEFLNKFTGIPVPNDIDQFVDLQFIEAANK